MSIKGRVFRVNVGVEFVNVDEMGWDSRPW